MQELKARNRLNPDAESSSDMPKKSNYQEEESDDDDDDDGQIGPIPPPLAHDDDEEEEAEDDDDDDDLIGPSVDFLEPNVADNEINRLLPISHEATLVHGTKTVTTVTIDPNGNRLATGGYDYEVKLWDFAGMDASMRSFRTFEPFEK